MQRSVNCRDGGENGKLFANVKNHWIAAMVANNHVDMKNLSMGLYGSRGFSVASITLGFHFAIHYQPSPM